MVYERSLEMFLVIISILCILLIIPLYIVCALSEQKVLKLVSYRQYWFAWIPLANTYALMDAFKEVIIGFPLLNLNIGNLYFKIIYFVALVLTFIGAGANKALGFLLFLILLLLNASIYTYIYAVMENTSLKDTKILGLISGIIPIIPVVKFLMYNQNNLVNNQIAYNIIKSNTALYNSNMQMNQGFNQNMQMNNGFNQNMQMNQGFGQNMQMNNGFGQNMQMNNGFDQNTQMNQGFDPNMQMNQPMQMNQDFSQNQLMQNQQMQMDQSMQR